MRERSLREKVIDVLEDLKDAELFSVYNEYADKNGYEWLYTMEEFDDFCIGLEPHEIARNIYNGDFNPNNKYFTYNGYGNFVSFEWVSDYINFEDLADYIIQNNEAFCIDELEELFEEDNEGGDE